METHVIIVVAAVALLASTAQGLTGFGFGLVAVPFLLLVLGVRDAVVISSLLGVVAVALLAVRVWRDAPWRIVVRLLLGSVAGMPLGLAALVLAPQDALRIGVGVSAIVMAAALTLGMRIPSGGTPGVVILGVASGVLRTSTAMSGPPVVLYLQGRGYPPKEFRAALTIFFLLAGAVSIGAFFSADAVSGEALVAAAIALPVVPLGIWSGDWLLGRIDAVLFRRLVLTLLVATALSGIGSSIQRIAT